MAAIGTIEVTEVAIFNVTIEIDVMRLGIIGLAVAGLR